jgi:hypothetical protein
MNRILIAVIVVAIIVIGSAVAVMVHNPGSTNRQPSLGNKSSTMKILSFASSLNPYEVFPMKSNYTWSYPYYPNFTISAYSSASADLGLYIRTGNGSSITVYAIPFIGYENVTVPGSNYSELDTVWELSQKPGDYTVTAKLFNNHTVVEKDITEVVNPSVRISKLEYQSQVVGNQSVYVNATVQDGVPPYLYKWTVTSPAGISFNYETDGPSLKFLVNETGNWSVNAYVRDDLTVTNNETMTIKEVSSPQIKAEYNPVDANINDNFTVATYGNLKILSLRWTLSPGGTYLGNTPNITYRFSNPGGYVIYVQLNESNGYNFNLSLHLVVNPPPTVTAQLKYNATDNYVADLVNVTAINGTPFTNEYNGQVYYDLYIFINWTEGYTYPLFLGPNETDSVSFTPDIIGSYNISVVIVDAGGSEIIDNISIKVNPSPTAEINVTGNLTLGEAVLLNALVSGGTGPYNYSWEINGPNFTTMQLWGNPVRLYLNQSGYYYLELDLTDAFGETDYASYTIEVN